MFLKSILISGNYSYKIITKCNYISKTGISSEGVLHLSSLGLSKLIYLT